MWNSLPGLGTAVLYGVLVAAAYTFAVALAAARAEPRLLRAARLGAYGTAALVGVAVLLLAYAFLTHDFRIRYVARYSDRSMSTPYLVSALWGGQDGSLLWWLTLLSGYTAACVKWMEGRYRPLQPYVIATLMVITSFFGVLMLFAANPFETNFSGARLDGDGLNPLLQNFYMAIHPPSLYLGFVGCSVPFAFSVAALVSGRLDSEWVVAVRKWMLFAWLFLSIGNALGMLWAYEELGWGGYWAWDPVENAAALPWFSASAYVHSTMIQERRNMLRVWNVVLISITFFLTIFGTFLTRSGLISSVHSFAQSDIGVYFIWFMGFIVASSAALIVWRLPLLRSRGRIEALASREAAFVVNNWVLLGCATFIAVATLWPRISEWLWSESLTVGPPFFNRWMAPLGLTLLALMGAAPLFGWSKTSDVALKKAFAAPLGVMLAVVALHAGLGSALGFPARIEASPLYPGWVGAAVAWVASLTPGITIALVAFNLAVIVQEFQRGVAARRRQHRESVPVALLTLVARSRRRYGGYIVHTGISLMFLGFCGKAWEVEHEASLMPGQQHEVAGYSLRYLGPRMELDPAKRMIFADLEVSREGKTLGRLSPARFIYTKTRQPTSEASMLHRVRDDLYVVIGMVDPTSKRASFRFHVNPLVSWIWGGLLVLIAGASVSLWPELRLKELGVWGTVRASAAATSGIMASILLATAPAHATLRAPRAEAPLSLHPAAGIAARPPPMAVPAGLSLPEPHHRAAGGVGAALAAGLVLGFTTGAAGRRPRRRAPRA